MSKENPTVQMSRSSGILVSVTGVCTLLMSFALGQKPDLTDVRILAHAVSGNIYMLEETIDFVRTHRRQGDSLQQTITLGLPSRYDAWGYGYMSADGWIAMIWKSLDR